MREQDHRLPFLIQRDGHEATQRWYERTHSIYHSAGLRALEIGNRDAARVSFQAAKECLRISETLRT